jgi:hypothetical protein
MLLEYFALLEREPKISLHSNNIQAVLCNNILGYRTSTSAVQCADCATEMSWHNSQRSNHSYGLGLNFMLHICGSCCYCRRKISTVTASVGRGMVRLLELFNFESSRLNHTIKDMQWRSLKILTGYSVEQCACTLISCCEINAAQVSYTYGTVSARCVHELASTDEYTHMREGTIHGIKEY